MKKYEVKSRKVTVIFIIALSWEDVTWYPQSIFHILIMHEGSFFWRKIQITKKKNLSRRTSEQQQSLCLKSFRGCYLTLFSPFNSIKDHRFKLTIVLLNYLNLSLLRCTRSLNRFISYDPITLNEDTLYSMMHVPKQSQTVHLVLSSIEAAPEFYKCTLILAFWCIVASISTFSFQLHSFLEHIVTITRHYKACPRIVIL